MDVIILILTFWVSFSLGLLFWAFFKGRIKKYDGIILVRTDEIENKTTYSLVLFDMPESLQEGSDVIFRVESSEELNRE